MAAFDRIDRISEEVHKAIDKIIRDEVNDPRVGGTWSIVRCEVTRDLRYAKVFASFLQEDKAKEALKGLKSASGYLRRELGRALQLRYTPELVWALDDSITYGAKMMKLINSLEVGSDDVSDED